MTGRPLFHVAFPVTDIDETARFYSRIGGVVGRRNNKAVTVSLAGHQLVGHLVGEVPEQRGIYPRHFGLVFETLEEFDDFEMRLGACGVPNDRRRRFDGQPIAHWTMLARDPSGNVLEFKYYDDPAALLGLSELGEVGDTGDT